MKVIFSLAIVALVYMWRRGSQAKRAALEARANYYERGTR
jgi:hypothetical protein